MTNNIINAQLAIDKAEQALLTTTEQESGIRVALSHGNATISAWFSTPADAWKFGQAVSAYAVRLMTPMEVEA